MLNTATDNTLILYLWKPIFKDYYIMLGINIKITQKERIENLLEF